MSKINKRYSDVKRVASNNLTRGGFSWYRLYRLASSRKNRKRVLRFGGKVLKYGYRKVTGKTMDAFYDYRLWLKENDLTPEKIENFIKEQDNFSYNPLISVLIPVYNPPVEFLEKAIDSVRNQIYPKWEICIADDCSTNKEVKDYLLSIAKEPGVKVKFRTENGHISACSNSCLEISEGEYVALLDQDDLITPDALFKNVKALNENPELDLIYSDEDKLNAEGRRIEPHFKPDWSPDNLLSRNYITHFAVMRKRILDEIEGFRIGLEGSQDYDLFLRFTERTDKIFHIPEVLYHWRIHEASTAGGQQAKPYTIKAAKKALENALERRGVRGVVEQNFEFDGFFTIRYEIEKTQKVSIIIPSKDRSDLCSVVLESIFNLTNYPDFEVVLISNNSSEAPFFEMVKNWQKKEPSRFKFIEDNEGFNFARLMNKAAKKCSGDHLLFLNNDTKIIDPEWITKMVEQSQRASVGAVGVKLLYPNNTVQHAGVVLGIGGVASHVFVNFDKDEPGYFCYLNAISNFSAVTAACLMVKKKVFDEVDGMDENLAVEFNDVDFCLKVKESGYNNVYIPHLEVVHYESISRGHPHKSKKSFNQSVKEVDYFKSKWQKYIAADPCYNPNLSLVFTDFRLNIKDQ